MEEKNEVKKDTLIVQMLGDFRMTWNGKQIGSAKDSQFTRLLEILIHHRDQWLSRSELEDLLFEDSSSEDIHHLLRSVIYNTKQKLRRYGLPEVNYIEFKEGTYKWTDKIPVIEDAQEFEKMIQDADAEKDKALQSRMYLQACHYYQGEFLPCQTRIVWVIREDKRYQEMFMRCIDHAVQWCRDTGDYKEMERIGRHASKVLPLAEWEGVTMEALLSMDKYDEAMDFYEKAVNNYMSELGVRPSFEIMDILDKLGDKIQRKHGTIDDVQGSLSGIEELGKGGYLCSYPIFRGIYRMVERMLSRSGQSVYLMLCTITDSKGKPMRDGAVLDKLSQRLEASICDSIRHSDAVCRYGKGQYLVLLVNTTQEDCGIIEDRINDTFRTVRQRVDVNYYVSPVAFAEGA